MKDFDKIQHDFMKSGKAKQFDSIVNSPEGKRLGKTIDGNALKKAASEGDSQTMNKILSQVLSTEDGKKFVQNISKKLEGNK